MVNVSLIIVWNLDEWIINLPNHKNDIKQQFEIPFWFYFTEAYREKHPEIYKKVLSVKDKRYMTDIISHTLIYLAGISSKYYQSQYDILNPAYNQKRKRIIRNQREYETIN